MIEYRELDNLLLYEFLKNFALSLIGIFIPVYIVSQGMGLLAASLFIVISGVAGIVLSYPVSRLIAKFGFKHSLAASYLFLIPGLVVIRLFELSLVVIVASSILYNLGRLLHNISMNSEFAVDSDKDRRGSDSGKMLSLPSISRIIAPLVGGLIFSGLGFTELMAVTVFILFLSVIPLIRSEDNKDNFDYNFGKLLNEELWKTIPLFTARGIQGATAVSIFSLFVYMVIGGSIDVGAARALDSLGFVLTGLIVGHFSTKVEKDKLVLLGCSGAALAYLARGFLVSPFQVFLLSFISGIFFQIYHVPVFSSFADEAERTEVLEFYTLKRIFLSLGNILSVSTLVMFFLVYNLRTGFIASFTLGGAATLVMAVVYWREKSLD